MVTDLLDSGKETGFVGVNYLHLFFPCRDLDSEGKVIKGSRIGAPGFLRLTTNQDERSCEQKPWDMVTRIKLAFFV